MESLSAFQMSACQSKNRGGTNQKPAGGTDRRDWFHHGSCLKDEVWQSAFFTKVWSYELLSNIASWCSGTNKTDWLMSSS